MSKTLKQLLAVLGFAALGFALMLVVGGSNATQRVPVALASPGTDMFLKIGNIQGESQDVEHMNEIDVLAWSWGMSQGGAQAGGRASGAGRANIQDLSVTKFTDKSTPELMKMLLLGEHIPEAIITVRKAGERPFEYFKITMQDVIITSMQLSGNTGGDRLTENVTLNFTKFRVDYTEQKPDGSPGDKPSLGWDIKKNQEL